MSNDDGSTGAKEIESSRSQQLLRQSHEDSKGETNWNSTPADCLVVDTGSCSEETNDSSQCVPYVAPDMSGSYSYPCVPQSALVDPLWQPYTPIFYQEGSAVGRSVFQPYYDASANACSPLLLSQPENFVIYDPTVPPPYGGAGAPFVLDYSSSQIGDFSVDQQISGQEFYFLPGENPQLPLGDGSSYAICDTQQQYLNGDDGVSAASTNAVPEDHESNEKVNNDSGFLEESIQSEVGVSGPGEGESDVTNDCGSNAAAENDPSAYCEKGWDAGESLQIVTSTSSVNDYMPDDSAAGVAEAMFPTLPTPDQSLLPVPVFKIPMSCFVVSTPENCTGYLYPGMIPVQEVTLPQSALTPMNSAAPIYPPVSIDYEIGMPRVSCIGTVGLRLRHFQEIEITIDRAIKLYNQQTGITIVLDRTGTQTAVVHPIARLKQSGSRVELVATGPHQINKYAKIWWRGVSFTSSVCALVYLVDEAGTRTAVESFSDLEREEFLENIFRKDARIGPEVIPEMTKILQRCQYRIGQSGCQIWNINGIRILQTRYGVIRVSRDYPKRVLRTSPMESTATITTPSIHATMSPQHVYVKMGDRRIHTDNVSSFIVRNGSHSAGFDEKNRLKVF
ncbi:unnamed protein product [Cyprideis torosa]|uniref:Uncharacterized protein n=1 Tax=Cyprideis torosa TaxID=163714 RepID=A0A7R8ZL55_9CRUS|nr:unnamed protein product [Cyprideis torosa]CAG0892607.1 unnamed protein product [Cyprideis torosa]